MSESTTRKRIVNVWHGVTGVKKYFYQIPRVLQDAELPALVVFPGRAVYDAQWGGEQMVKETREFLMVLYLAKAGYGTEGQLEIQADPFFDQVRDFFLARPGLELDSEGAAQSESVYDSAITGDGGLQVGPYPLSGPDSPEYVQIRWTLTVDEVAAITYSLG
jgi:hypothetical protein